MERLTWGWGIMGIRRWVQRNLPGFCHREQWHNLKGEECNGLGVWNIEMMENWRDGCPRLRSMAEEKWMNKKLYHCYLYKEKGDHKVKWSIKLDETLVYI